jgi:galactose mutarotase-like enzyme
MQHVLHPQPGYPFCLDLRVGYELSSGGLSVRTTAMNVGEDACPYGSGAHRYVTVGTATVDPVTLRAPARTVILSDERGIPTEAVPVEATEFDFREPRVIGQTKLDNASRISSATRTAERESSCATKATASELRSGWTRRMATSCSSPAIRSAT